MALRPSASLQAYVVALFGFLWVNSGHCGAQLVDFVDVPASSLLDVLRDPQRPQGYIFHDNAGFAKRLVFGPEPPIDIMETNDNGLRVCVSPNSTVLTPVGKRALAREVQRTLLQLRREQGPLDCLHGPAGEERGKDGFYELCFHRSVRWAFDQPQQWHGGSLPERARFEVVLGRYDASRSIPRPIGDHFVAQFPDGDVCPAAEGMPAGRYEASVVLRCNEDQPPSSTTTPRQWHVQELAIGCRTVVTVYTGAICEWARRGVPAASDVIVCSTVGEEAAAILRSDKP